MIMKYGVLPPESAWFGGRIDEAGQYFQRAVDLQPDYALAWTGVESYYGGGAVEGLFAPQDALQRGKAAALRADSLDDALVEAHVALRAEAFFADWNWPKALQECDRAIELDAKITEAYHLKAKAMATLGRHDEAILLERKVMELSPFERRWGLVLELNWARRFDDAITEARARLESAPADNVLLWCLAQAYRYKGMLKEAEDADEQAMRAAGNAAQAALTAERFRKGGDNAVIRGVLESDKAALREHYVSPVAMARLAALLKDREEALGLLDQGYAEHSPQLLEIQFDPAYDFLHGEERYRALIKKVGMPPAY